jgi:NodT family efflux transporter outer membrane factor (OMF) lipoprotein
MNSRDHAQGYAAQALIAGALLLAAGCAVGPNFEPPKPPTAQAYDTPESSQQGSNTPRLAEQPATGADVSGQWWQLFKSPALDQILRRSIADNPSLSAANATLAAAREAVIVARAGFLPRLGASAGAERSGSSSSTGVPASGPALYSVGLTGSYSVDAFGGTRRLVEQQRALVDMQRYQLAAAYLTLTGNVVTEVLTIASTRAQIAATYELLAGDDKNLKLTEREFEAGAAARTDVLTAEAQLASDQTTLPSLQQQLSAARHALALLLGSAPVDWSAPEFGLQDFALPADLPVSLPSALVRQRPDILAAEAQLHADSAAVGIAVAQEYPSITLSGALTREAMSASDLFHDFDSLWSIGGALTQPIFAGGALRAQAREARDTFNAQAATYREVVLTAFGQVADDLRALEHDVDRVTAFRRSLRIAADSLKLQRASYAAGASSVLQLIDAERSYSQALLGSVGADAAQLQDCVQLFVALGGGWWNSPYVPPS